MDCDHDRSRLQGALLGTPSLQESEIALIGQIRALESSAALPKKGVARPAYGMPALDEPPPVEQRMAMIEAANDELAALQAIRELKAAFGAAPRRSSLGASAPKSRRSRRVPG